MTARGAGPITATYRVQLNRDFTLSRLREMVPDLERLGISHVYCSPMLAARAGSRHGYDVVDPTRINPEIGNEDEWRAFAADLHARGMGIVLDIVPNHMATGSANPYWEDVLAHGESSPWAYWFDIDWEHVRGPTGQPHGGRIVLPVLGDELDAVLARGELRCTVAEGRARLSYFDKSWPVDPATVPEELQLAQWDPEAVTDADALVKDVEGMAGLRALVEAQHYRLAFWKRAIGEINYRRFFDVNDLVALRMEDRRVFDQTHALVLRWVTDGVVDGLRIDHIDGLLDPRAYLEWLRAEVERRGRGSDFPIWVEKILSPGERLRGDWPVQGTTGYEFLNEVEDVLVAPGGLAKIERFYRAMRRLPAGESFARVAYRAKVAVLDEALRADVLRLVRLLHALLATDDPAERTPEPEWLRAGITHFIAGLPVYRTYLDARSPEPEAADRAVIERAVERVRAESPDHAAAAALVSEVMLGRRGSIRDHEAWLRFVQRLQQTSGPAAAKGVEDTALYVYFPLASLNEVGGAPDRPLDRAVDGLHAANAMRAVLWPRCLLCSTTHDTKRSADVRARLDALSFAPNEWDRSVARWRKLNRRHKSVVGGRLAPDTNSEYLLYQTLVAIWPAPRQGRRSDDLPDRGWRSEAQSRIADYALKAAREAKVWTSWTEPNDAWEAALEHFVGAILEAADDAPFLADVARFVAQVAPDAQMTTLVRLLLNVAAPGVTDIYQGDELWSFTLVDPDNRRPLDLTYRRRVAAAAAPLARAPGPALASLASDPAEPRFKLLALERLLAARLSAPELFVGGSYSPLTVEGDERAELFAFARTHDSRWAVAVAARPSAIAERRRTGAGEWGSKRLVLTRQHSESVATRWWSVLDGVELASTGPEIDVGQVLARLPVALLLSR